MTARDGTSDGTGLASPNQATRLYGLDGVSPVRPKGAFYVRFNRPVTSTTSAGTSTGSRTSIGFVAKSVDRPSVQPQTEELNQYNRKRIIHTGVKYLPINLTFYDTADSLAVQFFDNYARYYFGDFHQLAENYQDDILSETMFDIGTGYGFQIRPLGSGDTSGLNSQYYFTSADIMQVQAGEFTQIRLINPRITAYEPEALDYEEMTPSMVRMSLSYEAAINVNGGMAMPLSQDDELTTIFANMTGAFGGQVNDVTAPTTTAHFATTYNDADLSSIGTTVASATAPTTIPDDGISGVGLANESAGSTDLMSGVLSKFGSFQFT